MEENTAGTSESQEISITNPYYQHDEGVISNNFIYCMNCSQVFEIIEDLADHFTSVKQCHTLENENFLQENMKNFKGKNLRNTDSETQMILKGLVFCVSCGDHFTRIYELSKHCESSEKCQTKENEKYIKKYTSEYSDHFNYYNCASCTKTFLWASSLTKHVSKDHDKPKEKPKSKYEEKKFEKSKVEKSNVVPTLVSENRREYSLPHGWKKICLKRSYKGNYKGNERWDFMLETPDGQNIRKKKDLSIYLESNPSVKCVRSVTDLSRPSDLDRKWDTNKKNTATSSTGTIEGTTIEIFLPDKLPLPPDISDKV